MTRLLLLVFLCITMTSLFSCEQKAVRKRSLQQLDAAVEDTISAVPQKADTTYMPTGFYFLEKNPADGVVMRKENTDLFYSLTKTAFGAVEDIRLTRLETTKTPEGENTALCLEFNKKGTKKLADATGKPEHPEIALVLAGKLIYVIKNTSEISTGVVCISLIGYSNMDLIELKKKIDNKE